jgi:hypothetical protein
VPYNRIDKQDLERIVKNLSGKAPVITVAPGSPGSNVATFTIQFPTKEVYAFELFMSTSSAGANVSGTTYSTGLAVTTGVISFTKTANKILEVLTDATGKAVVTLTATAKPVGEYMCVPGGSGSLSVSPGTVTGSFG